MTDKIVVFSTCSSREEAARIARDLVESRLAACVNMIPAVNSVYRWQGAVEEAEEVALIVKSSRALFEPLRARIEKLSSYTTPEIVALPIVEGSEAYLHWMNAALAGADANE